ncbi:PAS domain S-box protein [Cytobacillus sp. FJAT-54145]|uniref:histidine kinase n=1 Tax=Cytobacillus spartinae TaxID=3299023 RepID=A0ABW6KD07_9BACI
MELNAAEILDRITDGFFSLDNEWNFTYVNKEATQLLFRDREDLINKNIWTEFPGAVDLLFYKMYHKAAKEQIAVSFEAYFPPLLAWFDVRAYPSQNGLSVFFKDITAKKQKVLENEQHYKSLFEQHPDAVFSFDLEGNYLSVNAGMEELLGYTSDEYMSLSYAPLVAEEFLEHTNEYFNRAANGITQNYETIAIHKEGHSVPVSVTNIPIIVDNEIVGVYGIAKDLTSQKQAEDILLRQEKLSVVGELSASIAHEIRNPLTSLKGFLQLLKGSFEVIPSYYDIMTDEISRIESITSELLLHAKPQAHNFHQENIQELTNHVVTLLSSQALINNTLITVNSTKIPPINCIGNQIKQVLINLLKNAIEAMPNGGDIKVDLAVTSNKEICIHIADEGYGIPKEFLNKIGLPFYTTKEKGTGLGMMTTTKIIESHGGRMNISSEVGKGTQINVYLPIEPILS